jgi:hypothetical protein
MILGKSFLGRARMLRGGFFTFLLAGYAIHSEAVIYTITSTANGTTYTAGYDNSVSGLTSWTAGGMNQLALQSLYYSENNGAVSQLTSPTVVNHGAASLTATYSISGIVSVADTVTLNGNTLGEQIKFSNLTGSSQIFSIFQYSDFVLGGAPGFQNVSMLNNGATQAFTTQTGGGATLNWSGQLAGGVVKVQANSGGVPFGAFVGPATALDNVTLNASGNAVFGYEFDGSLLSGNSLTISETSTLAVPEPAPLALISLGMLVLGWLHRCRRDV